MYSGPLQGRRNGAGRGRPPGERAHRGLRAHRRLPGGGTGRAKRLDRLALLARLRCPGLLRGPPRRAGARALEDLLRARGEGAPTLPSRHARAGDGARGRRGRGQAGGFHARGRARRGPRAHCRRDARADGDEDAARAALRLRLVRAVGEPPRRRAPARHRRPGHGDPRYAGRVPPRWPRHAGRVRGARGREPVLRPHAFPLAPSAPRKARRAGRPRAHGAVLERMDRSRANVRPGARGRSPVAHHAEGAHLCADRRHGGRAYDLSAGKARRRAQLGLPLLLAARCHADAARLHGCRLLRRGRGVSRVAGALGGGQPRADADHVRHLGRAPAARMAGGLAARLRGQLAGAHRQRGGAAAPARRVRRAHRRAAPGAQGRAEEARGSLGRAARAARAPRARLAGAGRRASGKCAARRGSSPTRRSCAGWRSTAA